MKSILESILNNLGIKDYKIEEADLPFFIGGRAGRVVIDGKSLGGFGEINPEVLKSWELEMPVASCELDVNLLFDSVKKS